MRSQPGQPVARAARAFGVLLLAVANEPFRRGRTERRDEHRFSLHRSGTFLALTALLVACSELLQEPASPPGTALVLKFAASAETAAVVAQTSGAGSVAAADSTSLTGAVDASNRGDGTGDGLPRRSDDEDPSLALADAFVEIDAVRVRILRDETVVRDTTVQLAPEGSDTRIRIELDLREDAETLGVAVELLIDGEPAYRDEVMVSVDAGDTTEVEVDPRPIPAEVRIPETDLELGGVGESVQLAGEVLAVTGESIEGLELTWESLDPEIVLVTSDGLVTALEEGTARVVGSYNAFSDTVNVSVQRLVEVVVVDPKETTLVAGETRQFSATLLDSEGNPVSGRSVTWTSSAETVATVDENGLVRAISPGEATIAAASGSASDQAELTVRAGQYQLAVETAGNGTGTVTSEPGGISCGDDCSEAYDDGTRVALTATPTTSSSFDSWSNCPSASGNTCTMNMTATRTVTATFVPASVDRVTIEPSADTIEVRQTRQLRARTFDRDGNELDGRNVTWTSSDTEVATVNRTSGLVTGRAEGQVTITATSEGVSAEAHVTVTPRPVHRLVVEPAGATILVGEDQQFTATPLDRDGNTLTGREVTWASSDTRVATVDRTTGLVTAVGPGEVAITATSEGVQGTAGAAVVQPPPAKPDLVVSSFEVTGPITSDANDQILVPVRVVVENQGNAAAGIFKVATEYVGPRGGPFVIAFTVPGQNSIWYPYSDRTLPAGSTVSFRGRVTFSSSLRGAAVQLSSFADSCSGDEFTPAYCRVDESSEDNNRSRSIPLSLP